MLSLTAGSVGRRVQRPKTPGRQPALPSPRVSETQRRALGEAYALQDSLLGNPPTLRLPQRPTLYNSDTPQLGFAGFDGLFPRVQQTGPSDNARLTELDRASIGPTPLALDAARNQSKLRGLSAQQDTLSSLLDTNPEQEGIQLRGFSPYNAPAMPQREYAAYPSRQSVAPDRLSMALAALGGLIAPGAAGNFAAMPITTASLQTEQNWQDALDKYRIEQWMKDTQYGDAVSGRQDQISTDLYNRQGLSEQDRQQMSLAQLLAPLAGQTEEAQSLDTGLRIGNGLLSQERTALTSQMEANNLRNRINQGLQRNALSSQQYASDVAGAVDAFEFERKDYLDRLKFAAETGDKRAQRELDAMRIDSQYRLGSERNQISRYSAETGRLNAQTNAQRMGLEQWKAQTDPNRVLEAVMEKDLEVTRAYERVKSAQDRFNELATYVGVGKDTAGNTIGGNNPGMQRAQQMLTEAEKRLQQAKDRAWNRYAPLYGLPRLPAPNNGAARRDKTGAVIPERVQPGETSLGNYRVNR